MDKNELRKCAACGITLNGELGKRGEKAYGYLLCGSCYRDYRKMRYIALEKSLYQKCLLFNGKVVSLKDAKLLTKSRSSRRRARKRGEGWVTDAQRTTT